MRASKCRAPRISGFRVFSFPLIDSSEGYRFVNLGAFLFDVLSKGGYVASLREILHTSYRQQKTVAQQTETEILEGYGLLADACKIFGIDVDLCESVTDRPFF